MLDRQRAQSISHHRSPEGPQVGRHSLTHVLIDRHVRRNLVSHRDQTLVLVRQRWPRSAHAVNLGRIVFCCIVFPKLFAHPACCGGRYFDLGDVIDLSQACLADQPARGELRIVTWGAHRRGDHLTAHDDRQGCFYDHTVDPIDSIHLRSRRRFVVLGECDVGKPNRRPRTRRLAHR